MKSCFSLSKRKRTKRYQMKKCQRQKFWIWRHFAVFLLCLTRQLSVCKRLTPIPLIVVLLHPLFTVACVHTPSFSKKRRGAQCSQKFSPFSEFRNRRTHQRHQRQVQLLFRHQCRLLQSLRTLGLTLRVKKTILYHLTVSPRTISNRLVTLTPTLPRPFCPLVLFSCFPCNHHLFHFRYLFLMSAFLFVYYVCYLPFYCIFWINFCISVSWEFIYHRKNSLY